MPDFFIKFLKGHYFKLLIAFCLQQGSDGADYCILNDIHSVKHEHVKHEPLMCDIFLNKYKGGNTIYFYLAWKSHSTNAGNRVYRVHLNSWGILLFKSDSNLTHLSRVFCLSSFVNSYCLTCIIIGMIIFDLMFGNLIYCLHCLSTSLVWMQIQWITPELNKLSPLDNYNIP